MKHIVRQLLTTFSFLGGWVLLLLVLYLVGVPLPHTRAFAAIGRIIGGEKPTSGAPQIAKTSPTWYLPAKLKICVPQRIYGTVGTETSVYYENLVLTEVAEGLRCEATCVHSKTRQPLGRAERRRWVFTPNAADLGEHKVRVVFKDVNPKGDQRPLAEGEFTLCVAPQEAGQKQQTSLLIVGDSITHMTTWVNALARMLSAPGNPEWKMLGTNRPPQSLPGVCHEGYGGFVWRDFLSLYDPGAKDRPYRDISPFVYKQGNQPPAADLPRYIREHCEGKPPQFVIFELGSNNVFGLPEDQADLSAHYIEQFGTDADNLLQAWHKAAPNARLGILVPAQFSVYDLVYVHNYSTEFNHRRYRQNHFLYTEMMMKKFSGREDENIFMIRADACFDPIDGYPIDNASHPNEFGASQYAASAYGWMKHLLSAASDAPVEPSSP
jgi:hypothetical protein